MEHILTVSELQPGDVYDISKQVQIMDTVRLLYHAIGYRDVVIVDQMQMDDKAAEVTLKYSISEGAYLP